MKVLSALHLHASPHRVDGVGEGATTCTCNTTHDQGPREVVVNGRIVAVVVVCVAAAAAAGFTVTAAFVTATATAVFIVIAATAAAAAAAAFVGIDV